MAISKKLEIIYHNGQPDGIRSIRRHLSTMTTYAAPAIRNAMIDYIRSQSVSFEAKNLNSIVSLDDIAKDEARSKHHFIGEQSFFRCGNNRKV